MSHLIAFEINAENVLFPQNVLFCKRYIQQAFAFTSNLLSWHFKACYILAEKIDFFMQKRG